MLPTIEPLDPHWFRSAAEHQARLTMPAGALGRLLPLGQQLCAIQETLQPRAEPAAVVVMAADHGVAEEGVSAYPQEVTGQMVANFLRGGAAINVLARRAGTRVLVVDMGVKHLPAEAASHSDLIRASHGPGTQNFVRGPAMSVPEADQAIASGSDLAKRLYRDGVRVIVLGEMGIANTTSASALAAVFTGTAPSQVTGRGTGINDEAWQRKCQVIERALQLHQPKPAQPVECLAALGGFEIAGLAGAALEAAAQRQVVVLDGFISSVAGLVAARLAPAVRGYLVASHVSAEAGHRRVLEALDLQPLLDLGLRLGEGSGAALALPLLQAAADIMRSMATFESAGVSSKKEPGTLPP